MDTNQEPSLLQSILRKEADSRNWRRAKWAYVVQERWSWVVGDYLAQHTALISVDADSIVIAVEASSWSQELTYWKPAIHERLNTLTDGETRHAEIRIRVWTKPFAKKSAGFDHTERGLPYHKSEPRDHDDLTHLVARVRDKYDRAVEYWIQTADYVRCANCQSPTLRGYRLCVACQYREASRRK